MANKQVIDKVCRMTNMVELAGEYTELKLSGDGIWTGTCPHPDHEDSTPSFIVWESKQTWACMGCHSGKKDTQNLSGKKNFGSDCFAFLEWISKGNKRFGQCLKELADRAGISLEENDPNESMHERNRKLAAKYFSTMTPDVLEYLEIRGIDSELITKWQIGFDGRRVVFPLADYRGNIKGFSRRVIPGIGEQHPKYRNSSESEGFIKREYLYGMQFLDRSLPEVCITEGQIDLILAVKTGMRNVVSPLGSSFTEQHADIIARLKLRPVFIMDNDEAGVNSMIESSKLMAKRGISSRYILLPKGMDLADMSQQSPPKDWDAFIEEAAQPYWQLLSSESVRIYNSKINEASIRLYDELMPQYRTLVNNADKAAFASFVWRTSNINLTMEERDEHISVS